jgi:hypothetical protein
MTWAESVAKRRPGFLARPWPDDEPTRALARSKIEGLSGSDPRVIDMLVPEVMRHAAWTWERLAGRRR